MTSLKSWCLLSLSVLLLLSIVPTETEVVQLMSDCEGFLLDETPPQIPKILINGSIQEKQYKIICQTYKDQKRFVTLYDTKNKIPVFSAYKYRGTKDKRPKVPWMMEPQLQLCATVLCLFLGLQLKTREAHFKHYLSSYRQTVDHLPQAPSQLYHQLHFMSSSPFWASDHHHPASQDHQTVTDSVIAFMLSGSMGKVGRLVSPPCPIWRFDGLGNTS
ncbi:hypothetical protein Q8A73_012754 [Channa argus]|nr:hypothetical protein Q8A73_012754 [Channa argus]